MNGRAWKVRATQFFLEKCLGAPADVSVILGNRIRKASLGVRIETRALWAPEPFLRKLQSLLRGRWAPSKEMAQAQALDVLRSTIFGGRDDWGDHLMALNGWHFSRDWELTALHDGDRHRADALGSFTVLTRLRYRDVIASPLNLNLAKHSLAICTLTFPMIAKMPVISVMYFLELQSDFAFDAIRRSKHPHADEIIAFLYDLLFLQQKVAISLLEFVRLDAFTAEHKGEAQLINAEVNAIMSADLVFTYLKASIEKTIALVGVTHGITGLDAKKDHKSRLRLLRAGLPKHIEKVFYAEYLFEFIASGNLQDLNSYRSGLLHKKGIADLQPHNYVGKRAEGIPLRRVYWVMHDQHAKNTSALLIVLALLTDDLVRRDPPPFSLQDIPAETLVSDLKLRLQVDPAAGESESKAGMQ